MPIYEYQCDRVRGAFRGVLSPCRRTPRPPCPKCGSEKVERKLSSINTEWLPGDVAWDRVGRSWD